MLRTRHASCDDPPLPSRPLPSPIPSSLGGRFSGTFDANNTCRGGSRGRVEEAAGSHDGTEASGGGLREGGGHAARFPSGCQGIAKGGEFCKRVS